MRLPSRRSLAIALLSGVLIALLAFALRPRPIDVDLATVTRGDVEISIREEGRTRLKDIYVVSAPVAGRVLRLDIEVGDPIVAGQTVLATLQPSDPSILDVRSRSQAESEVQAAEAATQLAIAEREQMQAERRFAEAELQRLLPLAERGTISDAELDRARLDADRARTTVARANANVAVRQSQLETARARLITARRGEADGEPADDARWVIPVRAPVDGRVMRVLQESEAVVAAGTPLMEAGDPRRLEIVVELLSTDAVAVEAGDPVVIEQWGGPQHLDGIVRRVEPFGFTKISALGIEEQRVNTLIDLTSPQSQWSSLGHGFRVEARIIIDRARDVPIIPVSSLFRTDDRWSVFVVPPDGRVVLRSIKIGRRNQQVTEVVEGLAPGERVITHPSDRVAAGERVVPRGGLGPAW